MNNPALPAVTDRQAKQLFADLRTTFTPLTRLHAPLRVGSVDSSTLQKLSFHTTQPQPIYLLQQGIWHAAVEGLGDLGQLTDEEMPQFIDPFTAARNLLADVKGNVKTLEGFLNQIMEQPNAAHILGRCLRESSTRTVWMVLSNPGHFAKEEDINDSLDSSSGGKV